MEDARVRRLVQPLRDQVADIDAALQRLEHHTYGACVDCGERVPEARLEVHPQAGSTTPLVLAILADGDSYGYAIIKRVMFSCATAGYNNINFAVLTKGASGAVDLYPTAIQSGYGTRLAQAFGINPDDPDTNAVVPGGEAFFKSDAALTVLSSLPGWGWTRALFAVPNLLGLVYEEVYGLSAAERGAVAALRDGRLLAAFRANERGAAWRCA